MPGHCGLLLEAAAIEIGISAWLDRRTVENKAAAQGDCVGRLSR
jgi:hypothetical protein